MRFAGSSIYQFTTAYTYVTPAAEAYLRLLQASGMVPGLIARHQSGDKGNVRLLSLLRVPLHGDARVSAFRVGRSYVALVSDLREGETNICLLSEFVKGEQANGC